MPSVKTVCFSSSIIRNRQLALAEFCEPMFPESVIEKIRESLPDTYYRNVIIPIDTQDEDIDGLFDFLDRLNYTFSMQCWYGDEHGNMIVRCEGTGEIGYAEDMRRDDNGNYITHDYFSDNYFECESCGCVQSNDYSYTTDYGSTYCESCYEENEDSTGVQCFNGRRKQFDKKSSFGSTRSFGVELETQSGRCSTEFSFDGKSDGSIDGTEFVSHKLRGDAGLKELKDFMDSGYDIEIDDCCGCHIHVNCSDLNDQELYAVTAAYIATEDWWYSQVYEEREDSSYCNRWNSYTRGQFYAHFAEGKTFQSWSNYFDRYHWINCASYCEHSTLENRLHHGTWNYAELKRWIILNLRFVRAARYLRLPADYGKGNSLAEFKAKAELALQWAASGSMEKPYTTDSRELVDCE